jgi:cobalt-zinc-cadmium efflux system outer membrane protein
MGRARLALGRVAYLKSRLAALEDSLADSSRMLELQRVRFDHGDLSGNDYDRLLVDSVVLESEVAQSRADYEASLETCGAVLLARCDADGANLESLDSSAGLPALDQGWDDRLSMRPDLRALELLERSAREDVTAARRRAIPDPSLNLGYNRDRLVISGDQPRTLSLGVSLALPLFDHGQADAARAERRAEELRQTGVSVRARARADAAGSLDRLRAVERGVAGLKASALPRSRSVLDSTLTAVGQGELSMTDLLLARRTHTELVLKVMQLQFDAFSIRNDLRRALGLDAEVARSSEGGPWKRP